MNRFGRLAASASALAVIALTLSVASVAVADPGHGRGHGWGRGRSEGRSGDWSGGRGERGGDWNSDRGDRRIAWSGGGWSGGGYGGGYTTRQVAGFTVRRYPTTPYYGRSYSGTRFYGGVTYDRPYYGGSYGYRYRRAYVYSAPPVVHYYAPAPVVSFGLTIGNNCPSNYYYLDPYCNERLESLGGYLDECQQEGHPPVVEVISAGDGSCVGSYEWDGDSWDRCANP